MGVSAAAGSMPSMPSGALQKCVKEDQIITNIFQLGRMTKRSSKAHVSRREKPIDVHLVRALRFFACSHYRRRAPDTLTVHSACTAFSHTTAPAQLTGRSGARDVEWENTRDARDARRYTSSRSMMRTRICACVMSVVCTCS